MRLGELADSWQLRELDELEDNKKLWGLGELEDGSGLWNRMNLRTIMSCEDWMDLRA